MIIRILILSCLFQSVGYSQSEYVKYYEITETAAYKKKKEEYQSAINLYKKAFLLAEPRGSDHLELASCYIKLGAYDESLEQIKMSIELGIPKRYIERLKSSNEGNDEFEKLWIKIQEIYPELRRQFYSSIDIETFNELQIIKNSDQEIREYLMSREGFFEDSTLVSYAKTIDSLNLEKVLKIIERTGQWPGSKSFGDAESGSYYVLLHYNVEHFKDAIENEKLYNHILTTAKKGIELGELTPFQFAYWIDYHIKTKEGKQLYGVPSYKKWAKIPFKDVENIDKRRMEIGLPSLETLYKRENKELPDWYKKGNKK